MISSIIVQLKAVDPFLLSPFCSLQDADLPPLDEEVLGGKFDPEKAIEAASGNPPKSTPTAGDQKEGSLSQHVGEHLLVDRYPQCSVEPLRDSRASR